MFIKPTKEAKGSILDIHEDAWDFMLYPLSEDVPCPWDADVLVADGKVIVKGGLGPGGPRKAYCTCECLVEDFDKYFTLEIPTGSEEAIAACLAAGWVEA